MWGVQAPTQRSTWSCTAPRAWRTAAKSSWRVVLSSVVSSTFLTWRFVNWSALSAGSPSGTTTGPLVLGGTVKRYYTSVFGNRAILRNFIHPPSAHFPSRWWYTVRSRASSRHFRAGCGWTRTRGTGWLRGSCTRWSLSGRKNRRVGGFKQITHSTFCIEKQFKYHFIDLYLLPKTRWLLIKNILNLVSNRLFSHSRVPMVPVDLDIGCEGGRDGCTGVSANLWREGQVWWDQTGKQLRQFWTGPAWQIHG